MQFYQIIKLIYKHIIALVVLPVVMSVVVFFGTANEKKTYQSAAMIYTGLASGYNIESDGNERFDNYAVNSAFDNFLNIAKSRQTIEQVGIELLATHLVMRKEGKVPMNQPDWDQFNIDFPEEKAAPFLQHEELDSVVEGLRDSLMSPTGMFFKEIFHKSESYYSIKTIGKVELKRMGAGDMVAVAYQTNDPKVCQKTLEIYLKTVLVRYKNLKQSETGTAVKYFENQLRIAFEKLSAVEQEIKDFKEDNRIINYQEQTRYIAEKQEDASDEYHGQLMDIKAAESARDDLEEKLKIREKLAAQNEELIVVKEELSSINTRIALIEISDPNNATLVDLRKRSKELTSKIKEATAEIYNMSHTIEGVKVAKLLDQWLEYNLEVDKANARATQFQEKMNDIEKKYDKFAPLGSQLSKLERKVGVAEKEYLEVLHGLNQARIKEQSVAMKANLTVVDEPSFPLDALPSKRKLLLVAAFLGGLILVLGFAFITEFLNNGIRSAEGAETITGMTVAGAIPDKNNKLVTKYPDILTRAVNYTSLSLESVINGHDAAKVSVVSSDNAEGKSTFIELIQNHWNTLENPPSAQLTEHEAQRSGKFSIRDIKNADLVVWIVVANQAWGPSQKRMLNLLKESGVKEIRIVVNGMHTYWLDTLIGELPIKRNPIRKFMKRLAKLEFSKKNDFRSKGKSKK
jgi:uncharacterized protein involved in exopolysaccharide biosynthesis